MLFYVVVINLPVKTLVIIFAVEELDLFIGSRTVEVADHVLMHPQERVQSCGTCNQQEIILLYLVNTFIVHSMYRNIFRVCTNYIPIVFLQSKLRYLTLC